MSVKTKTSGRNNYQVKGIHFKPSDPENSSYQNLAGEIFIVFYQFGLIVHIYTVLQVNMICRNILDH